ncbi:MAG: MBL fold metallo-hydrolase [Candidatus Margulisbacteria bacterium]|nr:MBL fold metallo-hydrolase [Candidatus Margulisiibacteriota bacterium]
MKIHTIKVGPIGTNCYIAEDEASREALIIDPGDEAKKILGFITENGLKPKYIVITHGHWDHIGGNRELKEKLKIPIYMHKNDIFGLPYGDSPHPDKFLSEGEFFDVGGLKFEVLHTPGHTPGGISLYNVKEKVLFSGDTLFFGTYGRVDLPYSDEKAMYLSLKKLLALPPETIVYPGHSRPTTIGAEQGLLQEFSTG